MTTPGDRIRDFCTKQGLTQAERDYLLGVLGEAVLAERERCARVVTAPPGCVCDAREDWCSCGAAKSLDELAGFVREGEGS
jgi:hypothetical protein